MTVGVPGSVPPDVSSMYLQCIFDVSVGAPYRYIEDTLEIHIWPFLIKYLLIWNRFFNVSPMYLLILWHFLNVSPMYLLFSVMYLPYFWMYLHIFMMYLLCISYVSSFRYLDWSTMPFWADQCWVLTSNASQGTNNISILWRWHRLNRCNVNMITTRLCCPWKCIFMQFTYSQRWCHHLSNHNPYPLAMPCRAFAIAPNPISNNQRMYHFKTQAMQFNDCSLSRSIPHKT